MAALRSICLERNRWTFEGTSREAMVTVDIGVSKIAPWAASCKGFHGYDVESIMRSWEAVLGSPSYSMVSPLPNLIDQMGC